MITVTISRGEGHPVYIPAVSDGAVWETETDGAPGRFTFSLRDEGSLKINEGDTVEVCVKPEFKLFKGYIFTRRYDHQGMVNITAYDQTRYLKNRDTAVYEGITATQLLRLLAGTHGLTCGSVADTKICLPPCIEDNKALADILRNALIKTEEAGGGRFILYDDFGALVLKKTADMRRDFLIEPGGGQNYTRTVTIDRESYNAVKLVCDKKTGRSVYTASDKENIGRWGMLQHFEKIADDADAHTRVVQLLRLFNREQREMRVGGVPGEPSVRAGCSLYVSKELTGGKDALYLVKASRHVWRDGGYFMDLELTEG